MSLILAAAAGAEFALSDQESEVYYHFAAVAGAFLQVEKDAEITGDVHSNSDVQLKKDSTVHGAVSAVGTVDLRGTADSVTEGAAPLGLPGLDLTALRDIANRVFEGEDEVILTDEVIADVVFVAGDVRLRGDVNGNGTVIATGDVRLDTAGNESFTLGTETRLSLIAGHDVRIGKNRPFRGVVRAGHDAMLEMDVDFAGVIVADNLVHVKQGARVVFVDFDVVAPVIELLSPADGSLVTTATPEISVALSDDFSGLRLNSVEVLLDDADVTGEAAIDEDGFVLVPAAPLAEGLHALAVAVTDRSDNEARAEFSFTVDTVAPVVTIESPADGALLSEDTVEVTGTVSDETPVVSVTVSGLAATLAGDGFSAVVGLVPGPNLLVVEATDAAGNVGTASVTVTLQSDATPPALAIESPPAGIFLAESRPEIVVTYADDDSGVDRESLAFSVNGTALEVACASGDFDAVCLPAADLPEEAIVLTASLRDLAGNTATASVELVVDTVGVSVAIDDPDDRLVTREETIPVSGTIGEGVTSVVVNDVEASLAGGGFTAQVPLREGTNMVVALANKANGNTGTASIEVTRDIAPPIVHINSPADGFVSISSSIAVTGLVNDIVNGDTAPRVLVNGFEAVAAAGSFMLMDLTLVPGPNTIEAVATDAVGNEGRHSISVTFRPPVGARLGVVAGNGQLAAVKETLPEPLVVAVTDDLGNPVAGRVVRFEVSRNSGTLLADPAAEPARVVQVPTDGSGRAAVRFTLGHTAGEGNNRVRASGAGIAGEVEFCASALAAAPDKILMVDGDNQRGLVGSPLATPLEALVVDVDGNPIPGVEVIFEVVAGMGNLDGQPVSTRRTGLDGVARAVLTLGRTPGINNNVVRASFVGLTTLTASFTASALAAGDPAQTAFEGVVLDSGQTPIPEAHVTVPSTGLETLTDAEGYFLLPGVPVGHIELHVDPADSPRPETFPPLHFETVTIAGQVNTLGQPIIIPAIDTNNSLIVGGAHDTTLTMEDVEGLTLTVFANSATFPDGSTTGRVTISQVHLDKVPMAPPSGTVFMPPAWTIQPAGVLFDPPARITIPNDGLAPGRVIDIFQFDHTLNEFINVGKGTVSDDAFLIVSDPGFGITRAGWGGCGQPPPPDTCVSSCDDGNPCTDDACEDGNCVHTPVADDTIVSQDECGTQVCQGGQVVSDPARADGEACDDMKFCTSFTGETPGADMCENGACKGEMIEDKVLAVGVDLSIGPTITENLQRIATVVQFVPGCELENEDLGVDFNFSAKEVETCCEEQQRTLVTEELSGGASLSLVAECNIVGIPLPTDDLEIDLLQGTVTLSGGVSGSGKVNSCDGCAWEVSGTVGLTPAIGAEIELFGLLEANLNVEYGGSLTAKIDCNGFDAFGCAGPLAIVGSITFLDLVTESVRWEIPGTTFCFGEGS